MARIKHHKAPGDRGDVGRHISDEAERRRNAAASARVAQQLREMGGGASLMSSGAPNAVVRDVNNPDYEGYSPGDEGWYEEQYGYKHPLY